MEGIELVIRSKDLLLYPDTVEVCLDKAYWVSAQEVNPAKDRHTEEKIMHWVDDDLFDHIEVRKAREFTVAGRVLLDKVLSGGGGVELTIVLAKSTMILVGPARERYNRQGVK
jgi:hypothetical protein